MKELKDISVKVNKLLSFCEKEYIRIKNEMIFNEIMYGKKINYDFEVLKFKYK